MGSVTQLCLDSAFVFDMRWVYKYLYNTIIYKYTLPFTMFYFLIHWLMIDMICLYDMT